MAYVSFSDGAGGAVVAPPIGGSGRFSALEWSVIAIAQHDGLSSLNRPGRIAMALGSLFGERRSTQLADPRLEALRRMAVLSWHQGYAVPAFELAAFHAAGFSPYHYETMLDSISRGRAARRRRT